VRLLYKVTKNNTIIINIDINIIIIIIINNMLLILLILHLFKESKDL